MIRVERAVKQLVVLSGKGGTGKTCISASLMHLCSQSSFTGVFVDADVDAANLALISEAHLLDMSPFGGSKLAHIDPSSCTSCGKCFHVCRFNAINKPKELNTPYQIIELLCDGCAACVYACPESAIRMERQQDGEWFHSTTPYGHLFHAELFPGAENTGKLVTLVKQNAKLFAEDHQIPLIIIDGPPGIGCPVISASAGVDLALIVTEPSISGIHDLERVLQTLEHFKIPVVICVNKADLYGKGTEAIRNLAKSRNYKIIGEIPFDKAIPQAMVRAQPITRFNPHSAAAHIIEAIWKEIEHSLFVKGDQIL